MVRRPRTLAKALADTFPAIEDPVRTIEDGGVAVDGKINRNPASVIGTGSSVTLTAPTILRGEAKLRAAIESFGVRVHGRTALDVGASTGGFTRVLLREGATRVYAVDAGHGQLLGSLRQDPRVVNLEATNLGDLTRDLVPHPIGLFCLDLSYLSLADAAPQLDRIRRVDGCDMIALVKPMFELHLPHPPDDRPRLEEALHLAGAGIARAGWEIVATIESPVTGARGAVEFLLYARDHRT